MSSMLIWLLFLLLPNQNVFDVPGEEDSVTCKQNICYFCWKLLQLKNEQHTQCDRHLFDVGPDPNFHFDADPDPGWHHIHNDGDPHADSTPIRWKTRQKYIHPQQCQFTMFIFIISGKDVILLSIFWTAYWKFLVKRHTNKHVLRTTSNPDLPGPPKLCGCDHFFQLVLKTRRKSSQKLIWHFCWAL